MPRVFPQLYVISDDAEVCAKALDDQRLFYCLMGCSFVVSSALRFNGVVHKEYDKKLFKSFFPMHPCNRWARQSFGNIVWCLEYLYFLHEETLRRGKEPTYSFVKRFPIYMEIMEKKVGFLDKLPRERTLFCNFATAFKNRKPLYNFSDYKFTYISNIIKNNKDLSDDEKTFESYKNLLTNLWKSGKPRWTNANPPDWYLGSNFKNNH